MAKVRAFITNKKRENCEDSFSVNAANKSIAIADGVSQSLFSKLWANILTKAAVNNNTAISEDFIIPLKNEWWNRVEEIIKEKEKNNDPYVERTKRLLYIEDNTAAATLTSCKISNGGSVTYSIIGDSCFAIVNKDMELLHLYSSKGDFAELDNSPEYIDSSNNQTVVGTIIQGEYVPQQGDVILLCTDAVSNFLRKHKDNKELIKKVIGICSHQEFENLINRLWGQGLKIDDITIVIIDSLLDTNFIFEREMSSNLEIFKEEQKNQDEKENLDTRTFNFFKIFSTKLRKKSCEVS